MISFFTWRGCYAVLIVTLMNTAVTRAATELDTISVPIGQSRLLAATDISRVSVGDGKIAEFKVIEKTDEVLVFGRSKGLTDVRIWTKSGVQQHYLVQVQPGNTQTNRAQLNHLLHSIAGISVRTINGETLVTGKAPSNKDYSKISAIAKAYPTVRNFVEKPGLKKTPTIYIKARFVEVRRSTLEQIGFDWSDTSPAIGFSYASDYRSNDYFRNRLSGFPNSDMLPLNIGKNQGYLGIGLSFNSVLDLLGENGEASVIAEPTLSCLSGSDAEFQAGGEVPIPAQGADGAINVIFRDYGILLKVSPVVGENGLIRTKVEVEVSDIDKSVVVRGIPGFSVRNASTEMNAPSGETLVIAGLVKSQDSKSVAKVPGVGDIPILGELFKSRRFKNDETELVVMVTPYLARDLPGWNRNAIDRASALEKDPDSPRSTLPVMD